MRRWPLPPVLLTAIAYFACAALTLELTRFDGGLAIVWLAGAVLFARLVSSPRRQWPLLTLTCLPTGIAASLLFGFGRGVAIPLAVISVAEAWGAAWLLKRICPRFGRLQSIAEIFRFMLVGGVIVPALSATASAVCIHQATGLPFGALWRDWYAGHALGLIAFAPPLLLGFRGHVGRWVRQSERQTRFEAAALLAAVIAATAIAFGQNTAPLVMVPVVPMIAATFRLGRFGAAASIVILMTVGLSCSLTGLGPTTLLHLGMGAKIQVLQIYFACIVLVLLPIAAELSARNRLLERLRAAEALHRLVLDRTSDVVLRIGVDGIVRYASPSLVRVLGYSPVALVGRSTFFVLNEDMPAVLAARERVMSDTDATEVVEYRAQRADGTGLWAESHMRATVDQEGRATGTVSILREVTDRRRLVDDLARRATTDPLTGLCNRRAFDEALAARLENITAGAGGCLAIFDLDHFKRVNDAYGHSTGDAVLVRFAEMLRTSVRQGDLVARLGGEEFAILLASATIEQAHPICERVRLQLDRDRLTAADGQVVRLTVSVGLAPILGGSTAQSVYEAADAALYRAKAAGRNRLSLAA